VSDRVCAVYQVLAIRGCKSHPTSKLLQPVAIDTMRGGNEAVGASERDGLLQATRRSRRPVFQVNAEPNRERELARTDRSRVVFLQRDHGDAEAREERSED
jgi:hypothetical protein